mmetsp:Transcript_24961/g.85419  ORF Transcript_24961/g.85419 Transcript_24961/m.85419 type:complete len:213 (+) Transcript_24961:3621-4259(+)
MGSCPFRWCCTKGRSPAWSCCVAWQIPVRSSWKCALHGQSSARCTWLRARAGRVLVGWRVGSWQLKNVFVAFRSLHFLIATLLRRCASQHILVLELKVVYRSLALILIVCLSRTITQQTAIMILLHGYLISHTLCINLLWFLLHLPQNLLFIPRRVKSLARQKHFLKKILWQENHLEVCRFVTFSQIATILLPMRRVLTFFTSLITGVSFQQ